MVTLEPPGETLYRFGHVGYRFGIGFYRIYVWDWILLDIGLGLGHMAGKFGLGHMGYTFAIGFHGI